MPNELGYIKVINVLNKSFVYDANINKIALCPECLPDDFLFTTDYLNNNRNLYLDLLYQGFFKNYELSRIQHPYSSVYELLFSNCQTHLILQVTHDCNLRCKYCCYSSLYKNRLRTSAMMDFNVAKVGIDDYIMRSNTKKKLIISFYGGEPLLNFQLIKRCVEYIKSRVRYKEIVFRMTTNLTLLTDEIIDFLIKNEFRLLVSIDGPKHIHNKCRIFPDTKGSFDVVISNLKRIKERSAIYFETINYNPVLTDRDDLYIVKQFFATDSLFSDKDYIPESHYSISSLTEGLDIDLFDKIINNKNKTRSFRDKINAYRSDKERTIQKIMACCFATAYTDKRIPRVLRNGLVKNLLLLDEEQHIANKPLGKQEHPSGPCIPGCNKLMIDPNGLMWPCERVDESNIDNSIGSIFDGVDIKKAISILNIANSKDNNCLNCWAFRYCGQCIANCNNNACEKSLTSFYNVLKTYIYTVCINHEFDLQKASQLSKKVEMYGTFNDNM